MYCRKCGTQNPDGAKFCGGCGAPMDDMRASGQTAPGASVPSAAAPAHPARGAQHASGGFAASKPTAGHVGSGHASDRFSSTRQAAASAHGGRARGKAKIAAAVVVGLLIAAGGVFAFGKSEGAKAAKNAKGAIIQTFEDRYGADGTFTGFASNQYVGSSGYSVDSCNVTSTDGLFSHISGTIDAVVTNSDFHSKATLGFSAKADKSGGVSDVKFDVKSSENTPIKAVSDDEEHHVKWSNIVDSGLGDDAKSCWVKVVVVDEGDGPTWYESPAHYETANYSFDGNQWNYVSTDQGDATTTNDALTGKTFASADGKFRIEIESYNRDDQTWDLNYYLDGCPSELDDASATSDMSGSGEYELQDFGNGAYGFEIREYNFGPSGVYNDDVDKAKLFVVAVLNKNTQGLDLYRCSDYKKGRWVLTVHDWPDWDTIFYPEGTVLSDLPSYKDIVPAKDAPDMTLQQ